MTAPPWWPTGSQQLLLRAAVLPGDRAREAWRAWLAADHGEAQPDDPSWRLLPQAYRNLSELDVDIDDLAGLKEAYTASWSRNQALRRRVEPTLDGLAAREIPTLVLKGAALAELHYGDLGARPMDDIDLLVPIDRVESAVAVLEGDGWRPGREARADLRAEVSSRHGVGFVDDRGTQLDLHWYSLWQSAPDDAFWRDSVELTLSGRAVRALNPTDQLLHVCVHGCGRAPGPVRWIADAGMVMRSASLDWERLVTAARERRISGTTERALRTVETILELEIPAPVLSALAGTRRHPHERLAEWVSAHPGAHGAEYAGAWDRYRRLRALDPAGPTPPGFSHHLRGALGLAHRRDIVRHVAGNAARVLLRRVSRRRRGAPPAAM